MTRTTFFPSERPEFTSLERGDVPGWAVIALVI